VRKRPDEAEGKADNLALSRREVLICAPLVGGGASLSGCVTPDWQTGDPTGEPVLDFYVRRPEDQLDLRFTFWNARLVPLWGKPLSLRKRRGGRPFTVRVEFREQHVLERAYLEDQLNSDLPAEPPVPALLSQRSRLVFEINWADTRLFPLTLRNLLDWSDWRMLVVPPVRPKAQLAAPGPLETSIELPTRLILSPGPTDRWATPRKTPRRGERTELWHARLVSADPDGKPSLRAVWTPDLLNQSEEDCFRNSLVPTNRRDLVLLTHTPEHGAEFIEPDALLLSSLGGWLKLRKEFDRSAPANKGMLKSWEHRAAQGRDEFVEVQYAAILYPFGFAVSVIVTTERKVNPSPAGHPIAYLRQRIQIKFDELERTYAFWDMPFTALSPEETLSPPLDQPQDFYDGGSYLNGAFWPKVGGKPYEFRFVGVDHDGQPIKFTAPLICIMEVDKHARQLLARSMAEYRNAQTDIRRRSMGGAQVAVSPSANLGRTAVGVDLMDFDGRPMSPGAERVEIPWRGFEPRVPLLKARLSNASANRAIDPGSSSWFEPYDLQAPGNHNEVFLLAHAGEEPAKVTFGGRTADSGGFIAPRFNVGGVSRINGPFGSDAAGLRAGNSFAGGKFDPREFFGADATLFGGVSLGDIFSELVLKPAGIRAPAMLSLLEAHTDSLPFWQHTFTWETDQLKSSPPLGSLEPILLVAQDAGASVPIPGVPTMLTANGTAVVPIFDPAGAYANFDATLSNFCLQLVAFKEGIRLKVNRCSFTTGSEGKSRFDIDILDYELVGTMMSFVKMLQDYLSKFSENSPIDISPKGVTLSLPSVNLPPITLGAFNLDNVRIVSGAFLPFDGSPLEVWFALSTAQDPFMVTVGLFGGGGHIRLAIDTRGVKAIEASLRFGAYKEIRVGPVNGRGFILGGLSYSSKRVANPGGGGTITKIDYAAFVHAGGSGTVLGFLSISIDYHVGLFIEQQGSSSRMYGAVVVTYSFKIGFFKRSVSVRFQKNFKGSDSSRAFISNASGPRRPHMSAADWREYRTVFARVPR
jgi:hypothetical protein